MKITNTKDTANSRVKICIYGQSGIGKTSLASTLKDKTIVLSLEGGTLSLQDHDIDMIDCTVDDKGTLLKEADRLTKMYEAFTFLSNEEVRKKYKVVFVDSLTEIGDCLFKVLDAKYAGAKNKFEVWGEFAKSMESIIRMLRDTPHYDVIMTALEKEVSDDSGNLLYVRPELPGQKAHSKLMASLDEYFRYSFVDKKRMIQCDASPGIRAKDRSGKLNLIEEPNLDLILKKIRGGK